MSAPMPDPALGSEAIPTTPCDVCGVAFGPGDTWNYHARLGVYVHSTCAANFPVRGEDITTHTVLWGQIPEVASALKVTAAYVRACEAASGSYSTPEGVADAVLAAALDVEEMARVLGQHRIECTGVEGVTCRGCRERGWMSWHAYAAHQAAMLAKAGLLDDAARPEGIERWEVALALTPYMDMQTRYRATADVWSLITRKPLAEHAQIATQAPAEQPHAPSGGNGTGGGLGERLRAEADYQDRPGAYDELRAMADEADRLERQVDAIRAAIEREAGHGDAITRCNLVAERFRDAIDGPKEGA